MLYYWKLYFINIIVINVILFFSPVIPNSPEDLEILNISEHSATVRWKPPAIRNLVMKDFKLKYQMWIAIVIHDSSEVKVSCAKKYN